MTLKDHGIISRSSKRLQVDLDWDAVALDDTQYLFPWTYTYRENLLETFFMWMKEYEICDFVRFKPLEDQCICFSIRNNEKLSAVTVGLS